MPAMNSRSRSRGHWPADGIDEHNDGLSGVREFSLEHFDREDHVVPFYQRSFAQGYDNLGHLPFGVYDRNCGIGRIVCKGVFPLADQFHECIPGHVAGGSQASFSARADRVNVANRTTMIKIDFIRISSKFKISSVRTGQRVS